MDFDAVVQFAASTDALPESALDLLRQRSAANPAAAVDALVRVTRLRESLYAVLSASLEFRPVSAPDLRRTNEALRMATARHVLLPGTAGGVRDGWDWQGNLDEVVWPMLVDAWDVLTGPVLRRVKECPGDNGACGWLFVDASRNGTRRWCDMRTCGNRSKVRAHLGRLDRQRPPRAPDIHRPQ